MGTSIWAAGGGRHLADHRPIAADELLPAILADRRAGLLSNGFAGLDDTTLRFFASHPAVMTELYQHAAPVFASFGSHLRIRDGAVLPPGGSESALLWEAVLGEHVREPGRFVRALYERGEGRIAYLYDTIAQRPPAARRASRRRWG